MNSPTHLVMKFFLCLFYCLVSLTTSAPNNTCNVFMNNNECVLSCIDPITEEHFKSLPLMMPSCSTTSFYLSKGNYTTFSPNYFYKVGEVSHFFFEITDVHFDFFPNPENTESAFTNLTFDTSAVIYLVRTSANHWNWKAFTDMLPTRGGVASMNVYSSNIQHLDASFRTILGGSVNNVRFSDGKLKTLADEVFSSFSMLQEVLLIGNELSMMKRNYFPNPARMLMVIRLENNKISKLPADFFLNMPSLNEVSLSGNHFITIDEVVFRPILSRVQMGFASSTLHCDCNLRWLKYAKIPSDFESSKFCQTPKKFLNVSLDNLSEEDLCEDFL